MRRIIGLTGGISTGKTIVSNYLAEKYNLPILDADIYAREAVQPSSPVLSEIVERYGSGILFSDGTLNRLRLGQIIFNSPSERLWLEQRIHPYVRDRMESELKTLDSQNNPTVVLVVPLLFEARMTDLVTETWVVRCQKDQQLKRLVQRDNLNFEQAEARINSQMPIEKKAAIANVVLDNFSTLEALFKQVDAALKNFRF